MNLETSNDQRLTPRPDLKDANLLASRCGQPSLVAAESQIGELDRRVMKSRHLSVGTHIPNICYRACTIRRCNNVAARRYSANKIVRRNLTVYATLQDVSQLAI